MATETTENPVKDFLTLCDGCNKPMFWATRPANELGQAVAIPLDPRATVYLVCRHRGDPTKAVCMSGKTMREKIDKLVLKDGTEIDGNRILGLFVSHFATCPKVGEVKARTQQKRAARAAG